jgi:uncharacterized protein YbjT (DUF2867 family)
MYAITGITGNVGGAAAEALLAAGLPVRAVLRDPAKAGAWAARGCEIAFADIDDAEGLASALGGVDAAFVMVPSNFDPAPGFAEARHSAGVLSRALAAARPGRVVYLSTIGAQAAQENLLTQHGIRERALRGLPLPVTFLRPGWFMENFRWDLPAAREGTLPSFLQPLDKPVPMVATADIGALAAALLQDAGQGQRVVELEGPRRYTPLDVAEAFTRVLGHPVVARAQPREGWEPLFLGQGMRDPLPRIRMLDGFNQGWIDFEGGATGTAKGATELVTVLRALAAR